ncbi:cobalamin synthase [Acetobacter nitrogenifigens DSM 23921 = NBRC 105050]|uniref:Adenosylcobinamide-GDP ribazoletransferase n=1 Tax=Acetobacter nitrogenifigens DSM 23921 = NBRC 105050 TaxID=1120919 RepID=A0A511X720_9PROT|nr:adenosylcobinamide-GDP ribazoletransferase [Acetobacter nitrogenifigens]GBQ95116.1 cobalamin synthase [Acetobacter nitrogenifigens DSM 23921 = NBRC 105050]GEN58715.1 adenosylcobinamide-GDP ribazoletransferase [Acetobacter nitrogenifigens DSM 23921 = NBRC 105050]
MMRAVRADFACGLGLLTRLPTGWLRADGTTMSMARSSWTWPLVGALIGLVGGAAMEALRAFGLSPPVAALCALCVQTLLTGGLHEDGLADVADGFGGGRDRERKLAIMRDSRIGSYGALALVLTTMLRASAIAAIPADRVLAALVLASAASRGALPLVMTLLPPAREDGLGRSVGKPPVFVVAFGLAAPLAFLLCTPNPFHELVSWAASIAATGAVTLQARRQIGGYTGDTLGASVIVSESMNLVSESAQLFR